MSCKPPTGGEKTYRVDEGDLRDSLPRNWLLCLHHYTYFVLRNPAQRASVSSNNARVLGVAWPSHMSVHGHPNVPLVATIFRRRVHGEYANGSRIVRGGRQRYYESIFQLNFADMVNQLVPAASMSEEETLIKQHVNPRMAEKQLSLLFS